MTSSTSDRVDNVFSKTLQIPLEDINDDMQYSKIPQWDSIAHMSVLAALEEEFGIMIDMDDVIGMSSIAKAKEIVAKYGAE